MGARRRRGLADLIGEVGSTREEDLSEGRGPERTAAGGTETGAREDTRGRPLGGGGEAPAPREGAGMREVREATPLPKYLALTRKEARLREDQVDSLTSLARRVNRRKASRGGERITENTLIRVAVDWLLSQEAYVGGSSEEEIRRGLGVPEPRFRRDV
jgi:hypothetical protein